MAKKKGEEALEALQADLQNLMLKVLTPPVPEEPEDEDMDTPTTACLMFEDKILAARESGGDEAAACAKFNREVFEQLSPATFEHGDAFGYANPFLDGKSIKAHIADLGYEIVFLKDKRRFSLKKISG